MGSVSMEICREWLVIRRVAMAYFVVFFFGLDWLLLHERGIHAVTVFEK